jgi:hypothetical protein
MKNLHLMYVRRREEEVDGEKVNLQEHFCQHWRASAF